MANEKNLSALNEIAEKCGGTAQNSNAKAIKEIADNFSGGGGGGGVLVVSMAPSGGRIAFDKTWQEIYDAVPAVMVIDPQENDKSVYMIYEVYVDEGIYMVDIGHGSVSFPPFSTDSPAGYPSAEM